GGGPGPGRARAGVAAHAGRDPGAPGLARPGAVVRRAGGVAALAEAPGLLAELAARCDFPPAGTQVCCAVSGGADSLALLALAGGAGGGGTAGQGAPGVRPGSDREASVVRSAAERLGAAFRAERVVVEPGANVEARAR